MTSGVLLLEAVWGAVTLSVLTGFIATSYEFEGEEGMADEAGVVLLGGGGAALLLSLATAAVLLSAALRHRGPLTGAGKILAVVCALLHLLALAAALLRGLPVFTVTALPALLLAALSFGPGARTAPADRTAA
ncbi:hypothetical protein [Streptomyces chattanoogensis]|uniref:hypothetical protein n=1 Tax=Streptomyces chattanoogensis TaxID=66876 RepID=UPI003674D7F2